MLVKQNAVRLLMINPENKVLFLRMLPRKGNVDKVKSKPYWLSPGGRLEPGETLREAAIRELFEETGFIEKDVTFGPIVFHGKISLTLKGKPTEIYQEFLVVHTKHDQVSFEGLMEDEKEIIHSFKWFDVEEIKDCEEPVYPRGIEELLKDILAKKYPTEPLEVHLT